MLNCLQQNRPATDNFQNKNFNVSKTLPTLLMTFGTQAIILAYINIKIILLYYANFVVLKKYMEQHRCMQQKY